MKLAAIIALAVSSCGGPGTPLVAFVLASCASAPILPPPPPPPCPSCQSPVALGQLFTQDVPSLAAIPYAARAWADNGNLAAKGPSAIPLGLYTAAYRVRGVTVPPACIARKADGSPAYEFGDTTETPIDFTNPVCIALKEAEILAGLHGQTVLSIDNVDVHNSYAIVGVYQNGALVRRYTGGPADPVWISDNITWIKTLAAFSHAHGLTAWINDTGGSLNIAPADWQAVCAQADGCMQEGWPLDGCYQDDTWKAGRATGAAFDNEFQELRDAGRPTWTAAYLCSGAPSDAANADNDLWVVASYLLAAKPGDVLSLSTTALSSAPVAYPAAMSPKLGQPLGPATGTRPYVRRFQGGTVYVNPGLTPVTADGHTLPAVSALIAVNQGAPPSAPPAASTGIEYGSMAQSNPFGPTPSALAVGAKLQRISMPIDGNPGGFSNDVEIATAAESAKAGVHVEINLFWSTTAADTGSGPIANDAAYVAGITSTLKKVAATGAVIDLVIIENEETEGHDTSTVAQVIQKYNDAIPAVHALGYKVADSGETGHSLNHWFAHPTSNDPALARTVALGQYIATSNFDYCNVHFYPDMNNPAAEIPWLMAQEKRACVIGEMGTYDDGAANTLAELNIGAAVHAPMIIYWNQQSQTQPKAIALINDQGVLGPNGVAFKARATGLASGGS